VTSAASWSGDNLNILRVSVGCIRRNAVHAEPRSPLEDELTIVSMYFLYRPRSDLRSKSRSLAKVVCK